MGGGEGRETAAITPDLDRMSGVEVEEMHNRGLQVAVTIVKAELRSVLLLY